MWDIFNAKKRMRDERRRAARTVASVPARIFLPDGQIECMTADLSVGGAKLAVSDEHPLPREFDVWLAGGVILPSRLIWRSQDALGIKFL
jgi:hypothetical protein